MICDWWRSLSIRIDRKTASYFEIDMQEGDMQAVARTSVPSIPRVSNCQCLACAYSYSQNRAGQPLEDRDDCLPRGGDAINGILDRTRGSIVLHAQCPSNRRRRALGVDCFEASRAAVDLKPRSDGMLLYRHFPRNRISWYDNVAKSPGSVVQKLGTTNTSSYSFFSSLVL